METITAILDIDKDGTLHLPLPPGLRSGKVVVTATLTQAEKTTPELMAAPGVVALRKSALQSLRDLGGLKAVIPDPASWQREQRIDRSLPGRE